MSRGQLTVLLSSCLSVYQKLLTKSDDAAFKETPDRIRLARFAYDPMGPSPVQTFPVIPEIIKMGIPVSDVVFAFNSNWGGNLTCIYRVSVLD